MPRTKNMDISSARSALKAMEIAGFLNWNVRKERIFFEDGEEIKDYKAIVRETYKESPKYEVFTVASNRYRIIQNEGKANIIDEVTKELDARYIRAAEYKGGKTVLELKRESKLWVNGKEKTIHTLIDFWNSFNRTKAFAIEIFLFSEEFQTYVFSKSFSRRHVSTKKDNLLEKIETQAKRTVAAVDLELGNFLRASELLGEFDMSDDQLEQVLKAIFKLSDDMGEKKQDKIRGERSAILDIFRNDDRLSRVKGTAWAAYLSVSIYLDSKMPHFSHAYSMTQVSKNIKSKAWEEICNFADVS